MRTREDGTIGVMQDLGRNRPEDEPAESSVSVSGYHDQIRALEMRKPHDLAGRISRPDDSPDIQVPEFLSEESVQPAFRFPLRLVRKSGDGGAAELIDA